MRNWSARLILFSALAAWMSVAGCGGPHQSEEAARKEVAEQEEIRKVQEVTDAAANEELRRSEKQ